MFETTFKYHNNAFQLFHDELDGNSLNDEAVLGIGGATQTLLNLIPNNQFASAWDLGCGSGAIALAISTHCKKVIATDISERAIEYATKSAAANKIQNIEFKLGSLFEPVANQKFDLVVSNPPFVIGNATALEHRESPFEADGLAKDLLQNIPNHLKENGLAIFLTTWLETENESWEERIEQFLPEGINAFVVLRDLQTPDQYVETWMSDAKISSDQIRVDWKNKLAKLQTRHIAFGFVVLQKVMSGPVCQNINDARNASRLPNGEEVLQTIDQIKQADSMSALDVLTSRFTATTSQNWRGDVALDGVLSGLRANLSAGLGFDEAVDQVSVELNLDSEDVRVYGLAGVKTLMSMGLLALNTPRI